MDIIGKDVTKQSINNLINSINSVLRNGGTISAEEILETQRDTKAIRKKLMQIYDTYREPRFSHTSYRSYFSHARTEQRAIDRERQAVADAFNRPRLELDLSAYDDISSEKEKIIEVERAWWGLCPFNKNWSLLLQNKHEVDFAYFTKNIKYYGSTSLIASPDTVTSLIKDAEAKGLSKKQLAELFMGYCAKHAKELNAATASKFADKDYRGVYACVVNRIDDIEERDKIDEALKKIVRLPGQNINVVIGDLENLLLQNINIHQPYASEQERTAIAGGYILNNLKFFVNSETLTEYNKWLKKALGTIKVDKAKAIEVIEEIEQSRDKFKLTVEKRLPKEISVLDLAATESVSASVNVTQREVKRPTDNRQGRERERDRRQRQNDRRRSSSGPQYTRDPSRSRSRTRTPRSRSASVQSLNNGRFSRQGSSDRQSQPRRDPSQRDRYYRNGSNDRRDRGRNQERARQDRRGQDRQRSLSTGPQNRNDRRSASNDRQKSNACFKCGDTRHWSRECFRYATMTKNPCRHCARAGRGNLMHDDFSCRFRTRNNYRSPSNNTRQRRQDDIRSRQSRSSTPSKN